MVTVYDVPADKLIERVAKELKGKVEPPAWAIWVKTGRHREKSPERDDWWYVRLASVLRKIYIVGPIGTSRLAAEYGGKADRGSARYHAVKGSRNIIRKCMQQLETLGYVQKTKEGRVITPAGRSFLDRMAYEVMKELVKENKDLEKYMA